jgi:hypothetical protein
LGSRLQHPIFFAPRRGRGQSPWLAFQIRFWHFRRPFDLGQEHA